MRPNATIEERLAAVEKAVAELQRRLAEGSPAPNWLDHITGSVTDDEAFREMVRLGREFRISDRPADEPNDAT